MFGVIENIVEVSLSKVPEKFSVSINALSYLIPFRFRDPEIVIKTMEVRSTLNS